MYRPMGRRAQAFIAPSFRESILIKVQGRSGATPPAFKVSAEGRS
jgi:hypothetical protein